MFYGCVLKYLDIATIVIARPAKQAVAISFLVSKR